MSRMRNVYKVKGVDNTLEGLVEISGPRLNVGDSLGLGEGVWILIDWKSGKKLTGEDQFNGKKYALEHYSGVSI